MARCRRGVAIDKGTGVLGGCGKSDWIGKTIRRFVGLSAVALTGCTQVYTYPPGGPIALNRTYLTLPVRGERQFAPPLPPGTAFGHTGIYDGDGQALNSQGARCSEFIRLGGFTVRGTKVRFGPFRGTITPTGRLTLIYARDTIVGQFDEAGEFQGVWRFQTPPCSYAIRLRRAHRL